MDQDKRAKAYLFAGFVFLLILLIALGIFSLYGQFQHQLHGDDEAEASAPVEMHPLVVAHNCQICHRVDDGIIGPSYLEVADKYQDADDATREMLAEKIVEGGSGNWGNQIMIPHPNIPPDDVRTMVDWILGLDSTADAAH